jgi:hypothetical protein
MIEHPSQLESKANTQCNLSQSRVTTIGTHRIDEVVGVGVIEAQQVLTRYIQTTALDTDTFHPSIRERVSQSQTRKFYSGTADSPERRLYTIDRLEV